MFLFWMVQLFWSENNCTTWIVHFLSVCFSFYVFWRLPNVKIFRNVCFGFLVLPCGLKYIEKQYHLLTFQSQMKHSCVTYHTLMCFYLCLIGMSHTSKCNLGLPLYSQICVIADCLHRVGEMEPFGVVVDYHKLASHSDASLLPLTGCDRETLKCFKWKVAVKNT